LEHWNNGNRSAKGGIPPTVADRPYELGEYYREDIHEADSCKMIHGPIPF
jgi:hypothetical protein